VFVCTQHVQNKKKRKLTPVPGLELAYLIPISRDE